MVWQLRPLAFLAAAVFSAAAAPAFAADPAPRTCFSPTEQRVALTRGEAVPLAQALASVHAAGRRGELVRAHLCKAPNGLTYVLTLLSRNGKVTRASVDAGNGRVIDIR